MDTEAPDGGQKFYFEYPDRAGYPDGSGFLNEGTGGLVAEVGAHASAHAAGEHPPLSDYEIDVFNDQEHLKYEAWLNEDAVADLQYTVADDRVELITTTVRHAFRGHGIATELIAKSLDDIRGSGRTITIICPIVRTFIDRFHQYSDLVDAEFPGVRSVAESDAGESAFVVTVVDEDQ